MQKTLAIVIPAYKPDYLEKTLTSLANQSSKGYTLYIGDDASPYDLKSIVSRYSDRIHLTYHRFEHNLGATDLVAHWNRCIRLCQDEEWICLFSDDDIMQKNCVAVFQESSVDDCVDVLHFQLEIIDGQDKTIQQCPPFPDNLTAEVFFDRLFRRQLVARMPEFIFRRRFLAEHGFVPFDLAWRSDTATVMSAALSGGIQTLSGPEAKVCWRASDSNISGIMALKQRKNVINIEFFNWVHDFFERNGIKCPMSRFYLLKTIVFALEWYGANGLISDGIMAAKKLNNAKGIRPLVMLFVLYRLIYRLLE